MINNFFTKKRHLFLYIFSAFSQPLFYWFLAITAAKRSGIETLGEITFCLAILGPLTILGSLQMRSYLITSKTSDHFSQLKWLRLVFPILLYLIVSLILVFTYPTLLPFFIPLMILKWSEIWSESSYGFWQRMGKLQNVNKSMILRYGTLLFILSGLSFIFSLQNTLIVLCLVAAGFSVGDYWNSEFKSIKMSMKGSSQVFYTTVSLSFSALLTSILINIPRLQIEHFVDVKELGFFSALFYFFAIPSLIINYLCQGQLKELGEKFKVKTALVNIFLLISLLVLVYGLGLEWWGGTLLSLLYSINRPWETAYSLGIGCCLLTGSLASLAHYLLLSHQIYDVQLKTNILSSFVTIVAGTYFIPQLGIPGAFLSFLLGLLIQFFIYVYHLFSRTRHD